MKEQKPKTNYFEFDPQTERFQLVINDTDVFPLDIVIKGKLRRVLKYKERKGSLFVNEK